MGNSQNKAKSFAIESSFFLPIALTFSALWGLLFGLPQLLEGGLFRL
jgi:hypothetical protein